VYSPWLTRHCHTHPLFSTQISSVCDVPEDSFQGEIFLVAFYNKTLSQSEVLQNFRAFLPENPTVALNNTFTVEEDVRAPVHLYAYDLDHTFNGTEPTFTVLSLPSPHGSLFKNGAKVKSGQLPVGINYNLGDVLEYQGGADETGPSFFYFRAYDEDYGRNTEVVWALIKHLDTEDAPRADDQEFELYYEEDTPLSFLLEATEIDEGQYIEGCYVVEQPSLGGLTSSGTGAAVVGETPYPINNISLAVGGVVPRTLINGVNTFNLTYSQNGALGQELNGQPIVGTDILKFVAWDGRNFSSTGKVTLRFLNPLEPHEGPEETAEDSPITIDFTGTAHLPVTSFDTIIASPPKRGYLFPAGQASAVVTPGVPPSGALQASDFPYKLPPTAARLDYLPAFNAWGKKLEELEVSLSDAGAGGTGWVSGVGKVPVYVSPRNNAPVLEGDSSKIVLDHLVHESFSILLSDVDDADVHFTVTMQITSRTAEEPTVEVKLFNESLGDVYFTQGDGHFGLTQVFTGSQAAVTLALSNVT